MSRNSSIKLSFLLISILFSSCATYDVNYSEKFKNWDLQNIDSTVEVEHTFYLIGDAGNANEGEFLTHFNILKKKLSSSKNVIKASSMKKRFFHHTPRMRPERLKSNLIVK